MAVADIKLGADFRAGCVAMKLRALRRLQREGEASPFVFVSEQGSRVDPVEIDNRIDMPAGW
jgi:hypothetical protein